MGSCEVQYFSQYLLPQRHAFPQQPIRKIILRPVQRRRPLPRAEAEHGARVVLRKPAEIFAKGERMSLRNQR